MYFKTMLNLQIFTGQVASTGLVALCTKGFREGQIRKIQIFRTFKRSTHLYNCKCHFSVQVSLASDFIYNLANREATASLGYDYMLRQVNWTFVEMHVYLPTSIDVMFHILANKFDERCKFKCDCSNSPYTEQKGNIEHNYFSYIIAILGFDPGCLWKQQKLAIQGNK